MIEFKTLYVNKFDYNKVLYPYLHLGWFYIKTINAELLDPQSKKEWIIILARHRNEDN